MRNGGKSVLLFFLSPRSRTSSPFHPPTKSKSIFFLFLLLLHPFLPSSLKGHGQTTSPSLSSPSPPFSHLPTLLAYLNTLQSKTGNPFNVASLHHHAFTFSLSASDTGALTWVQL